jgi:hypothetical protein
VNIPNLARPVCVVPQPFRVDTQILSPEGATSTVSSLRVYRWAGHFSRWSTVKSNIWKSRYQPNVQLRMLYLTNETGPLRLFKPPSSYHWMRHFQVFPYPLHIWNRKWKWHRWNFFIRFRFPDYWMDGAFYAPNPKLLSTKLWTWSTYVTHVRTHTHTDTQSRP